MQRTLVRRELGTLKDLKSQCAKEMYYMRLERNELGNVKGFGLSPKRFGDHLVILDRKMT